MPRRCEMKQPTSAAPALAADERGADEVEPEVGRHAELQQAERVGADAEEGAVAERRQPGVAEQEVVAERVEHPDDDLDAEIRGRGRRPRPTGKARQKSRPSPAWAR